MRTKILIDFSGNKYSDAELIAKTDEISGLLKGNDKFPDSEDLLKDVVLSNDDFKQAVLDHPLGGTLTTLVKRNRRRVLEEKLKLLAEHVQMVSAGDDELMISTGFTVYKKPSPIGILPAPRHLSVKTGDLIFTIKLACSVVHGARFYTFEYTELPVTDKNVWISHSINCSRITFNNLVSGCAYAFRAAGVGSNPIRIWSEVVSSYVL